MADATRRVSVRLSLDDAARVKQELREVGETGQRSLERIQGGADRASRALDLLDVAVRGVQIAGLVAGLRAVVVAGDALTQSMGRLNTALGSVERAGEIYDRLYRDTGTAPIPTLRELGMPLDAANWFALLGPARTPQDVVARIAAVAAEALRTPAVQEVFRAQGILPVGLPPAETRAFVAADRERLGPIVRNLNIRLD